MNMHFSFSNKMVSCECLEAILAVTNRISAVYVSNTAVPELQKEELVHMQNFYLYYLYIFKSFLN